MHLLASIILALLPFGVDQSATNGHAQVAVVSFGTGTTDQPDQTISTTIQDPEHPGEPWVVTTFRRKDESFEAFVKRHKDMVEAVRKALS